MGKGLFITALAALSLAGIGRAAEAEAIAMTDGPGGSGRSLGAAWSMACPGQQRLVGVRVHQDKWTVVGVEALCARLTLENGLIVWAADPSVAEPPDLKPSRVAVTGGKEIAGATAGTEGHVLRASSDNVSRFKGSRAVLISVPRAAEPQPHADEGARITLATGRRGRTLECPAGGYVQGLRTGTAAGRRGGLVSVQIICTQGDGRSQIVGAAARARKAKIVTSRTQCAGASANPHDGAAGRALIGAAEGGRVVSLGLVCARAAVPGPVSAAADTALQWLARLAPLQPPGSRRVYRKPTWYAGSSVAVCRDGSGRGYCAQESADRFCVTMTGAGPASFYIVGTYAEDAIATGGKRCPSGKCRAFQSITCAGTRAGRG